VSTGIYNSILEAVRDKLKTLTLAGIDPETGIKVRKLPKATESLDSLPCVIIAPAEEPEEVEPLSAEDDAAMEVVYSVDVVAIADDDADFSTNLDRYLRWREQVRLAFQPPRLAAVAAVFDTDILPFSPLDRQLLNANYAYTGHTIRFHAAEQRNE
jgi:hypothetical protein